MPEDKSAVEQFLNELSGGKDKDPFKSTDPFAAVAAEEGTAPAEEEPKDEKPLAFHKDPKVQRFIDKKVAQALKDAKPPVAEVRPFQEAISGDAGDVVAAFTEIIGNDTPEKVRALKALEKTLSSVDERAATKAIERFKEQTQAEQQRQAEEEAQAQQELDDSFEDIEETYNVDLSSNTAQARKMRGEFVEYIRKISPKNEAGEVMGFPDLPAAFEEFQERQKRPNPAATRAKALASRGMERSNDASVTPTGQGKSWKDIDKLFNNLSS